MADKQAVLYIMDVGPTMAKFKTMQGDQQRIDVAKQILSILINSKVIEDRKSDYAGLLLFGAAVSRNPLFDRGDGYEYVHLIRALGCADLGLLRCVEAAEPGFQHADLLDALIVGIEHLQTVCKKLKYEKRIVLVTDAEGDINTDDVDAVRTQMIDWNISLDVIGLDFNDTDAGLVQDNKPSAKAANEDFLRGFANSVNGELFPASEAVQLLMSEFKTKRIRPSTLFRGDLIIGDPGTDAAALCVRFPIWVYAKTMEVRRPSAKKWAGPPIAGAEGDVNMERRYKVFDGPDPEARAADDETERPFHYVEHEMLERAYKFGKTLVPVQEVDENSIKLQTDKSFVIRGFVKAESFHRELLMSNVYQIIAPPGNQHAMQRLSALIHAMELRKLYAIGRYVRVDNSAPKIGVMYPKLKGNKHTLFFCQIPYAEDFRRLNFASLNNPISLSGSQAAKRRLQPSEEQMACMQKYMESMSLICDSMEEKERPEHLLREGSIANPEYQRAYQVIQHRALHPDAPLPPPHRAIEKQFEIPEDIKESAASAWEACDSAFYVAKVEKTKAAGEGKKLLATSTVSIDDLLGAGASGGRLEQSNTILSSSQQTVMRIAADDPVGDFELMIGNRDEDLVNEAVRQMQDVIVQLVFDSVGDAFYRKAIACLRALRETCRKEDEAQTFNAFLHRLRNLCLIEKVAEKATEKASFWEQVVSAHLTLITEREAADSRASPGEAEQFLSWRPGTDTDDGSETE